MEKKSREQELEEALRELIYNVRHSDMGAYVWPNLARLSATQKAEQVLGYEVKVSL
jgi:hypothetical protein